MTDLSEIRELIPGTIKALLDDPEIRIKEKGARLGMAYAKLVDEAKGPVVTDFTRRLTAFFMNIMFHSKVQDFDAVLSALEHCCANCDRICVPDNLEVVETTKETDEKDWSQVDN